MGNRIIKESAFTSDKIAELSDFEFRLWVGLITVADDAGRGDARPAIIKGRVFALRDRVTVKDIDASLHGLAAKGCISLYTVGGKSYFLFPTWAEHQRVRDVKPKYPGPEEGEMTICGELPQPAADCGEVRPESESESNTNPNPNPNPKRDSARARFSPPTVEDVAEYCRERENGIDAEHFVDYYSVRGWKVGSSQMKDWKACVRTWEKRDSDRREKSGNVFADIAREEGLL